MCPDLGPERDSPMCRAQCREEVVRRDCAEGLGVAYLSGFAQVGLTQCAFSKNDEGTAAGGVPVAPGPPLYL